MNKLLHKSSGGTSVILCIPGYRSRLAEIPKLMVSATGDEFFLNQDPTSYTAQDTYLGAVDVPGLTAGQQLALKLYRTTFNKSQTASRTASGISC